MTIPCRKIPFYLELADYPLPVRSEKTGRILREVSQEEALELAKAGSVVGVGSQSHLRYLRMTRTAQSLKGVIERQRLKEGAGFRCEDNYTWEKEPTSFGWIWRHHRKHCAAFGVPIIAGKIPANFSPRQYRNA